MVSLVSGSFILRSFFSIVFFNVFVLATASLLLFHLLINPPTVPAIHPHAHSVCICDHVLGHGQKTHQQKPRKSGEPPLGLQRTSSHHGSAGRVDRRVTHSEESPPHVTPSAADTAAAPEVRFRNPVVSTGMLRDAFGSRNKNAAPTTKPTQSPQQPTDNTQTAEGSIDRQHR